MVAFVVAAGRVVGRRLVNDWLMLLVLTMTVLAAMVQLAAAPIYGESVTVGALRRILTEAPAEATTIVVETRAAPVHYPEINTAVTQVAESATSATGATITRRLESASSYDLIQDSSGSDEERRTVLSLTAPVGIEEHASLVDGVWPSGEDGTADAIPAALLRRAADELGVDVGGELTLNDRQNGEDFTARIVGVFEVSDVSSVFWLDDDLLSSGVSDTTTTRAIGPLVVDPSVLFGSSGVIEPRRLVATWLLEPRLDQLTVDDVNTVRRSLSRLPARLDQVVGELSPEAASTTAALDATTTLPDLLLDTNRSLAVTRSGLYAVVAQLAILAAMALVISAGLLIETRRREASLLEARGVGRRQFIAFALLEAAVLVVPVAVVAPWVAAGVLGLLGSFGPLATAGLAADVPVNNEAMVTVAVATVFVIGLLAWPSIRATTSITNPLSHHRRQQIRQLTQSLGLDVALLAVTAIAFWQLQAISSTPIAGLADRFSVDPVLVVTPALGLVTGAVLSLRVVPLLARVGERLATAGRSVIGALTGWQLARRPGGQARAAFLLVMAISIGFFAASYAATWDSSQADQADFQVGADLRVFPNRRTNDSITDLHLTGTHVAIEQVQDSMPVQRIAGPLPGSDRRGSFLLLDSTKAADTVSFRSDGGPGFADLMDELASRRPALPDLQLPGEAERLEFTAEAVEERIELDDPRIPTVTEDVRIRFPEIGELFADGEFLPPAFTGNVDVVVQDGAGLLHRLPAGSITSNSGSQRLGIDLVEMTGAGTTLTPTYPISIVDIQIRAIAPPFISRDVSLELTDFTSTDADGAKPVPLQPTDDRSWVPATATQGRSTGRPTIAVVATDSAISLKLATAASDPFLTSAQVLFSARPGSWPTLGALPVVVAQPWMTGSRTAIGDEIDLDTIRALDNSAVVVGAVERFPTVDPATDHVVIVDLPTVQVFDYELGRPLRGADEYWLSMNESLDADGIASVSSRLAAEPYESVDVQGRQRRYVDLTTDPAALATIGAFTIGFVVASVFAVLVFVAVTAVSARGRRSEFTLLRAFGLGPRDFVGWMTAEQLVMVLVSVVLGVGVGFVLSASVLPLISIGQQGSPAVPPADPRYPWTTIGVVVLAPLSALAISILISALRRERESLGSRLRDGAT